MSSIKIIRLGYVLILLNIPDLFAEQKDSLSYFPLVPGTVKTYDSNHGEVTVKTLQDSGESRFISVFKVSFVNSKEYLLKTNEGVFCQNRSTKALLKSDNFYYEPLMPTFLFPVEAGKRWDWEGSKVSGGKQLKVKLTVEIIGEDSVSVPAGDFICIKLNRQLECEDGSKEFFTQWLAPGVGVVKAEGKMEGTGITGFVQKLFGAGNLNMKLKSLKNI